MIDKYSKIIKNVFDYAGIRQDEVRELSTSWDGALLEIDFKTDWMSYICYIDFSAVVRGFFSEPLPLDESTLDSSGAVNYLTLRKSG